MREREGGWGSQSLHGTDTGRVDWGSLGTAREVGEGGRVQGWGRGERLGGDGEDRKGLNLIWQGTAGVPVKLKIL